MIGRLKKHHLKIAALSIFLLMGEFYGSMARAAETVNINLPASVTFNVTNSNSSTTGTPNPVTITYDSAKLVSPRSMVISVKADTASFSPVNGTAIDAGKVSWTVNNVVNGTGSNGTLSSLGYTTVYISQSGPTSGSFNMVFTLAAPGPTTHAGTYTLMLRWKIESVKS